MRHRTLILNRARALRKAMSEAEVMLWTRLRGRGPDRPTFRRQHPFGSIILDFYCPSARLAVEVDGATHWDDLSHKRDQARDRWLASQGVAVMRIPAADIYRDLDRAADGVVRQAMSLRLAPSTTRSSAGGPPPAARPARGR
jgi:very-short-patch-repair endonuclease